MTVPAHAQIADSLSTTLPVDSINVNTTDTIAADDDLGLDEVVDYFGKDSTVVDVVNERIIMYGDAWVKYGGMEVKGDYIDFSLRDYTAKAIGKRDSLGKVTDKAIFTEGDTKFDEDSLMYNFKTKRGISYGVRTTQSDAFLLSGVSKKAANNWISVKDGKFTTCDKPNPHYHFHLTRAMAIPDDKIVSGPLYLKFRKIPTPLALPFGFFPNKKESTHGILLPGYGNGDLKGYFLQNLGYYIPLGQHLDTRFLFDIYTRGSWAASNVTNYKKLYKYNGNFNLSRSVNKNGLPELASYNEVTNFNIRWTHNQDPKSRPNTTFGASVNLGSSQNFRNNLNTSQENFLSSTFTSQIAWSKVFPDTPFNVGVNLGHTQNVQTRSVDVTLPSVSANMQRITLGRFFKANPAAKRFFDNVGINGSANFSNRVSAKEPTFSFAKMDSLYLLSRNGIQLQSQASTSFPLLKHITTTASIGGTYIGSFKQVNQNLVPGGTEVRQDTSFGYLNAFNWNWNMDFNFRVYGMYSFRKGNLKAIRHVIQPKVGMSYTPYTNYLRSYIDADGIVRDASPFDISAYIPQSSREQLNMNFSVRQNFEAKVRDKSAAKASATKKVMLIESWNMSTAYNVLADSLNLSGLTMGAFTTIAKNVGINYNSSYSFYDRNEKGREINQYLTNTKGKLMRMRATTLAINFSLKSKNKNDIPRADTERTKEEHDLLAESKGALVDMSVPWNLTMSYSLNFVNGFNEEQQRDTLAIRQGALFNGSLTLFKYWAITFNSGYDISHPRYQTLQFSDFGLRDFTTTTLGLTWDLHCWEFTGSYVPFGQRKSYMFQLNIKSALLQDLKLQRRGNLGDQNYLY